MKEDGKCLLDEKSATASYKQAVGAIRVILIFWFNVTFYLILTRCTAESGRIREGCGQGRQKREGEFLGVKELLREKYLITSCNCENI